MHKSLLVLAALVLSGCSGYAFHTNLDPSNFKEYYKPSGVTEVTDEDLEGKPYKSKGMVTGLSCQVKEGEHVATASEARTQAKIKAVDLNANAIRFKQCVRLENTPACIVSYSCYADALIIEDK
ncbi:MAG: exopolysaccharide synthesis regulator RcsF [Succinatimonas sp.]|nr:exopolysaccharide synthesis regulator RcsF [Succinatimonas sp.]